MVRSRSAGGRRTLAEYRRSAPPGAERALRSPDNGPDEDHASRDARDHATRDAEDQRVATRHALSLAVITEPKLRSSSPRITRSLLSGRRPDRSAARHLGPRDGGTGGLGRVDNDSARGRPRRPRRLPDGRSCATRSPRIRPVPSSTCPSVGAESRTAREAARRGRAAAGALHPGRAFARRRSAWTSARPRPGSSWRPNRTRSCTSG